MKTKLIKNIYGYPSISKSILAYAKAKKYRIIVGISELNELPESKTPTIVLAGITLLDSFKIPIIGYTRLPTGAWHKCGLPQQLEANEVKVNIYRLGKPLPGTNKMLAFYKDGTTDDTFSSGFLRTHQHICLNSRVFKAASKEDIAAAEKAASEVE